ncbi:ribonuclease P protein component [Saccharicrinis carchari]|uniref:Ribonuclease P protein component n=1 Tax=Saccharicrinis carchari TaxID=1168039 RepID=A0A521EWG4_SACCC|nr:ribonuclease P protein component [Saccharicrinis carchari]SMO87761.1 ribonuclease P protein component [Saccharicrinis carchari]
MPQESFTFPKNEKLCSHTLIETLFTKGAAFVSYPFRVIYLTTQLPHDVPAQVLFSVSKKRFKRAVHRNLIKRRCSEAYRLNRMQFIETQRQSSQQVAFAMIYISNEKLPYQKICNGMIKSLRKLSQQLEQKSDGDESVD